MSEKDNVINEEASDFPEIEFDDSDEELDNRDIGELDKAIAIAQHDVYKRYLLELSDYPVVPFQRKYEQPGEGVQLLRLNELTHIKGEDVFQKLSTVYHSTMALGSTLIVLLDVKGNNKPVDIYVGVKNTEGQTELLTSFSTLKRGLKAQFPGTDFDSDIEEKPLVNDIFSSHVKYITSVSCVASIRDKEKTEEKKFIQGIEKLIDTMTGNAFTALFIAEPISGTQHLQIRQGYQELYSTLSPFAKTNWSFSEEKGHSVFKSMSNGTSKTTSKSSSKTKGNSQNIGINIGGNMSNTDTHSTTNPTAAARAGQAISGLAQGLNVVGPLVSLIPGVGPAVGASLTAVSTVLNTAGGAMSGSSVTDSISKTFGMYGGINAGIGKSSSTTDTEGESETKSEEKSHGNTKNKSRIRTIQTENVNKDIVLLLERIDEQLKRTAECEDYGAYNCGAYFFSAKQENSLLAANTYRALMLGEGSSVEYGAINNWYKQSDEKEQGDKVSEILEYLKRFTHPVFALAIDINEITKKKEDKIEITEQDFAFYTPATIVSGLELPLHIGVPTKSVYGLPVTEHAEFGRNISKRNYREDNLSKELSLGSIYHMGHKEEQAVALDMSELPAHTFITGSTGSGKTNTVCKILERLSEEGVKFLVVEPAKGEYKNKFGNREDVYVYGTNPKLTPMLRINPFSFPTKSIHILEHLDRLVEIFNVCWPMYAAMPAILKDAIEHAYEEAGWNLEESENRYGMDIFPSFSDICRHIEQVVAESAYSADNKSDYTGALVTRVRSLTNGLNGMIFSNNEISDEDLFERNVIVDLCRVGSTETKSLIMGMLVLKLQEHRMKKEISGNTRLKHVTVLEEAHNLLKRTSTEQASEISNLLGKSVEMLASSIAEMRAYGEGFIIADQSPGLLDMSVIRNTNTKIIMRLPDMSDRELVGRAAGLNDDQIVELGKLETGVAAIVQSGWVEAVLCKVDEFKSGNYTFRKPDDRGGNNVKTVLMDCLLEKKVTDMFNRPDRQILGADIPVGVKIRLLDRNPEKGEVQKIACQVAYELFEGYRLNDASNQHLPMERKKQLVLNSIKKFRPDIQKEDLKRLMGYIFGWYLEISHSREAAEIAKEYLETIQ